MKTKTLCPFVPCAPLLPLLTVCPRPSAGPTATQTPPAEHEPLAMMSGGKDSSGFIAYVKSVYPEISIQHVPYRGANSSVHV